MRNAPLALLPLLCLLAAPASATPVLTTFAQDTLGPVTQSQGPQVGGTPTSSVTTSGGASRCGIAGGCAAGQNTKPNAVAAQNLTVFGTFSALVADGTFFNGSPTLRTLTARTTWEESPLTAGPTSIDLLIKPGELSIVDFASIVFGSTTRARYRIELSVNGNVVFFSEAVLAGGAGGPTLTETGTDLGGTVIVQPAFGSNVLAYAFDPFAARIQLGNLTPTDVVRYTMEVSVTGPGFETGGYARIGDPFDLSGGGGVAFVPEPSLAELLGVAGTLGLAHFARRRR